MKHRRLLDAAIVGALLLAHVPGLTEELPTDWPSAPAALAVYTDSEAPAQDADERDHNG